MRSFLAIDWGTTNRRAFAISDRGIVTAIKRDKVAGVFAEPDYPAAVAALRAELGALPMLCAGMVGSTIGWQSVPYVAAPASTAMLAAAVHEAAPETWIVPGVRSATDQPADVMRGEEVQFIGAAALTGRSDGLFCQPGTHNKWATLRDGAVAHFHTAMTGELFALLRAHGILAPQLGAAVEAGEAFDRGVAAGSDCDLLRALFGVRASGVLGMLDAHDAASYTSGVLIGADVAAALRDDADSPVVLVAEAPLDELYARALAAHDRAVVRVESEAAFVAGAIAIWKRLP